jgi:threonine synthase
MKYTSTRDSYKLYTFEEALCSGYAPDGGLYVPQDLPSIDAHTLKSWSKLDYVDLATTVLEMFVDDIPKSDLHEILQHAFSGFDKEAVVPVFSLQEKLYMVELFHGPTFCFKDLGMRAVIGLLAYFAKQRQSAITLVVSTTGDTGPAAVQAVQDVNSPYLGILVHYPQGQISDFQRKQLTTATSSKIQVVAFQGGGDDMDAPIKNIMTDNKSSSSSKNGLICGVNSYNIGRPLVQMVHFVSKREIERTLKDFAETKLDSHAPNCCRRFRLFEDLGLSTGGGRLED